MVSLEPLNKFQPQDSLLNKGIDQSLERSDGKAATVRNLETISYARRSVVVLIHLDVDGAQQRVNVRSSVNDKGRTRNSNPYFRFGVTGRWW